MRKSSREKLAESKRKRAPTLETDLDGLLKLMIDGDRPVAERRLNPTQKAFIYAPDRIKAYKGPAGCAKTSTGVAAVMVRALLEPGSKHLIARHDYNDLLDTTMLRAEEMLQRLPPGTRVDRDKSPPAKWWIRSVPMVQPDGHLDDRPSQITFMGLKENPGGYEFNSGFIDEADEVQEQRVHWLNSRLRNPTGSFGIMLAFNPPDTNHWLYTACTGKDHTGKTVAVPWVRLFEPDAKENVRNLPEQYYERLTESLPEDMRRRLVDGEWGATFPGQPVYRQFSRKLHVADQDVEFHPEGTLFRFWDFGYGHPYCLWAQIDWLGRLFCIRELQGTNVEAVSFGNQVKGITSREFGGAQVIEDYGDIAVKQTRDVGQTLAALINECGITVRYRKIGIDESLRTLRKLFETLIERQPAITIDRRRCPILISALSGGYHLKDDGVTPYKDGYYDHSCDALRYGVMNTLSGTHQTSMNKFPTSIAYSQENDRV